MAALTARGRALRRMSTHRGITEQPFGSNTDTRPNAQDKRWGIRKAQLALAPWLVGTPWCGTWCAAALRSARVVGVTWRLASVAFIEDDAKARRAPFWDWQPPFKWRRVLRGDLVVLFGRGVHVEMVRTFKEVDGRTHVVTDGGNTSSGLIGSQSNGGGSYRRVRPLSDVYGFARVDYPGGAVKRAVTRTAMRLEAARAKPEDGPGAKLRFMQSSDMQLLEALEKDPQAPADVVHDLRETIF